MTPARAGGRAGTVLSLIVIVLAITAATFSPVVGHQFLNWDDRDAIVGNRHLGSPGIAAWAFTTRHMEHYQPLSWLAWSGLKSSAGLDPAVFHAANLLVHAVNALLLAALFVALARRGSPGARPRAVVLAAAVASLLYAVHPLRVEVVAWASALPYALALTALVLSLLAYERASETSLAFEAGKESRSGRRWHAVIWMSVSVAMYAVSLLMRPVALGYPLALLALDAWPLGRAIGRRTLLEKGPFALLALSAGAVEAWARAPGVARVPAGFALEQALTAPFVYAWRTLAPVSLTPLDVLPAAPQADPARLLAAAIGLAGITVALWRTRAQHPLLWTAWLAYCALLAPAAGLLPSGLQATADRYTYVPGIVLALAAGAAMLRVTSGAAGARTARVRRGLATAARPRALATWTAAGLAGLLVGALALGTRSYLRPWSDSIGLWTRVVSLDAANDVALYNLGEALAAAGRGAEAAAQYRQVLALDPAQPDARRNLDLLEAVRLESEGNALAARGNLRAAAEAYAQAVARDPGRTHSHAARGMALVALGDTGAAIPSLEKAVKQGVDDPAVPNALALVLGERGSSRRARDVLVAALARHPDSVDLAHNLARLLALSDDPEVRDPVTALRLAEDVVQRAGDDPRALDTLAAAYAVNDRAAEASRVLARAELAARRRGDQEMAAAIAARRRTYAKRPGK